MKHYTDMSAVTVSTRKSAKVKQSRYTPISDLQLPALTRTIIGWAERTEQAILTILDRSGRLDEMTTEKSNA